MDIAKFNQELAKRVNKAQNHERLERIKDAIDAWVSLTELVLKVSKTPNLPFSYKSMLLKKSEEIMEHVKELKKKVAIKVPDKILKTQTKNVQDLPKESPKIDKENMVQKVAPQVKEESEAQDKIKNLPEGFKEIKPSKDFKIITPHDEEYLDKILSMNKDEKKDKPRKIDLPDRHKGQEFCFACGAEILPNQNQCPQCGTYFK